MAVVYWLFDETCSWPQIEGYVGVTVNIASRKRWHHWARGYGLQMAPLFEGTRQECLRLEYELRPRDGIGWNVARGGSVPSESTLRRSKAVRALLPPPMLGKTHSEETKARMRASAKKRGGGPSFVGRAHSEETKAKLRAARLRQADPRAGKTHSAEAVEKMRQFAVTKNKTKHRDRKGRWID